MKQTLLCLLCLTFFTAGFTQSPYRFTLPNESAWIGGSGVGIGVSYWIGKHNAPFTPQQIADLHISSVPRFDRFSTRHYSASARHASDIALYSSFVLPALLLTDPAIRPHTGQVVLLTGEAVLVTSALTALTKQLAHRPRPYTYNPDAPLSEKLTHDARQSFFSGHTSLAATLSFTTAKIWTDYHPDSNLKPLVWVAAAAVPVTVGYLRMRGGKHYLSDVVVGMAVGTAVGLLVPKLHKK